MKRILFLSKSRLSQNLMELITPCIPKKVILTGITDSAVLATMYFPKPIQLIIIDENFLDEAFEGTLTELFSSFAFRHAKKVLVCHKNSKLNREKLSDLGIAYFHTKPFLAEELATIIEKYLMISAARGMGDKK